VGISTLLFLSAYNLHPDEAYYWVWSRHLDIGYFDNSPFVAFIIRLFTTIGRHNEFWVRLPAFLNWLVFLIFVFKLTKRVYKNERTAWLGVLIGTFVPLVASGSHIMTHDIPMIFFASLTWYLLYLTIEEEQKTIWYWVGLFFGLALFSKFQAVLIGLVIFVMLLLRPIKRKILLTKEPYIAALIGFLMFIPVLYWNWKHHWAAFLWQSQHGIHQTMSFNNELKFLAAQLLAFSPLLFVLLIYYTLKRLIKWKDMPSSVAFLLGSFLPVFCFFSFTSLTFPAEANWLAVGYLPAIVFLSGELGNSLRNLSFFKRRLLKIYLGFAIAISIILLSLIRYPGFFINQLKLDMSPKMVVINEEYGWDQLGKKVDSILTKEFTTQQVPIFGDRYQTCAELQFYISKPVVVFDTRQAHRNHFDFITSNKIARFDKQPGLLVLETEVPANAVWYFQGIKLVDTLTITHFGHPIRKFYFYNFQRLDAKALYEMAVHKPYGYPGTYPD
jgi:hypothetical protein